MLIKAIWIFPINFKSTYIKLSHYFSFSLSKILFFGAHCRSPVCDEELCKTVSTVLWFFCRLSLCWCVGLPWLVQV